MMTTTPKAEILYAFFGTGDIAKMVLEELIARGLPPALIITAPDKPVGRHMTLKPSLVAELAFQHSIETLKPKQLDAAFVSEIKARHFPLFVVADYGAFLPKALLDIPPKGTLNMHPSLLPRLRGPSPIRSAILLDEKKVGVSIMLVDEKMDHGPILAQQKVTLPAWPPKGRSLDHLLGRAGGALLADALPQWMRGEIQAVEQEHSEATLSKRFKKEDGLIDLSADPYQNLLKIRAFEGWPGTYTFFERNGKRMRVQIIDAEPQNGKLLLTIVKPEGKREMPYEEFMRSGATPATLS